MPPRRRVSAPVNRVYESGPTLHQTKFKSPPKTVKTKSMTTYGKKNTVRIPKPKVDNTLTQMGYVKMNEPLDFGLADESLDGQSDYEELTEKRKKKRRKTAGDEPSTTPHYHQSTMTQFARSFSSAYEDEEEVPDIHDLPSSSQPPALPKRSSKRIAGKENFPPPAKSPARVTEKLEGENSGLEETAPPRNSMPPPQTPQKTIAREIPSSQSPATPLSTHSLRSLTNRNPLQERRINPPTFGNSKRISNPDKATTGNDQPGVPLFTNIRRPTDVSPEKVPKLEIGDTFDTATEISQMTRMSSSARGRSSPAKSVRFAIPDDVDEIEEPLSPLAKEEITPVPSSTSLGSGKVQVEIQDSDAEDYEFDYDEFEERSRLHHAEGKDGKVHIEQLETSGNSDKDLNFHGSEDQRRPLDHVEEAEVEAEEPDISAGNNEDSISESNYGDIGEETQFQANRVGDRLTSSPNGPSLPKETQPEESIENNVIEAGQVTDTQPIAPQTMVEKTQMMETQRITSNHLQAMAPRTANSDVFVSMPPQTLTSILSRTRTHEMRNWALPPGVVRLWIYETKPVCALKYMCSIGPALRPGQITDEAGLGNREFNKKSERGNWRGYEIMAIYELLDPMELAVLLQREWFKQPPRTFSRVGPAVADELVGNLKPPLFDKMEVEEEPESNPRTPPSSQTDTQEAEAQLLNTMKQYTQPGAALSGAAVSQFIKPEPQTQQEFPPIIPSSQHEALLEEEIEETRLPLPPSQATTVDLSQTQTPRRHHHHSYHQQQSAPSDFHEDDDEIILESPTCPVPSSTPARIDSTPIQLPRLHNYRANRSGAETEMQASQPLVPHSMTSSQFLTRSQLLSESLLQESIPGPPPFVGDSEDEDDEEL